MLSSTFRSSYSFISTVFCWPLESNHHPLHLHPSPSLPPIFISIPSHPTLPFFLFRFCFLPHKDIRIWTFYTLLYSNWYYYYPLLCCFSPSYCFIHIVDVFLFFLFTPFVQPRSLLRLAHKIYRRLMYLYTLPLSSASIFLYLSHISLLHTHAGGLASSPRPPPFHTRAFERLL